MSQRYVLLLCSLNPDKTDLSGNQYPESGYVAAKKFKPDQNIQHGLYGTLWGNTESQKWMNVDPEAEWVVVKTEKNDDLIQIGADENFYKFRSGMVVYFGDRNACMEYVAMNAPTELRDGIAGLKKQTSKDEDHVITKGFASSAATEGASTHAVNCGNKGSAMVKGWGSCAFVCGSESRAQAMGDSGVAMSSMPASRAEAQGDEGRAVSLGIGSIVITGAKGIAAGLAVGCEGMAGEDGMLILAYRDSQARLRSKVGYVGEELEANTLYRLSESGAFEKVDS